ncbi:MAG: polyphenol oxidase family protein [Spirochaetaceae bacterium]|jgi:YfiH family protein|nr:polyphenol oxidase family protein [Spirochaetaceae bacterium]
MNISFFSLDFPDKDPLFARFPFVYEGAELSRPGCAVSSCFAGDMVRAAGQDSPAREKFLASLGLGGAPVFSVRQVHSRGLVVVDRRSAATDREADGLASSDAAVSLSVTVADCLPVFLYDTGGRDSGDGPFALVHSGWRGTGIVLDALRLMQARWHSRPETVAAVLGPCIQGCCYRVDRERARAFEAEFGGPSGEFPLGPVTGERGDLPGGPGFYLSMQAANARLLAGAGVRNIAVCRDCTFTDERLGSFRRQGPAYTRMLAVLGRFRPE